MSPASRASPRQRRHRNSVYSMGFLGRARGGLRSIARYGSAGSPRYPRGPAPVVPAMVTRRSARGRASLRTNELRGASTGRSSLSLVGSTVHREDHATEQLAFTSSGTGRTLLPARRGYRPIRSSSATSLTRSASGGTVFAGSSHAARRDQGVQRRVQRDPHLCLQRIVQDAMAVGQPVVASRRP